MSEQKDIRKELQKPFNPNEIEWRVQSQGKNKTGGQVWCQVLAYVDARALQNRLDDVFTPFGWEDKYEPLGDDFICTLTVDLNGKKVSKQNGASKSQVEGFKGGISNSFKRVCASGFGIGRYLYDLDVMFAETSLEKQNGEDWKRGSFKDKESNKFITYYWKIPKLPSDAMPKVDNERLDKIESLIQEKNADVKSLKDYIFDKFKANKFEDLTNEQSDTIIAMLEKKKKVNNDGK